VPNDTVSKAVSAAKEALAGAKKFTASTGDTDPSRFAAKPTPKPSPAPAPKPSSNPISDMSDIGAGLKAKGEQMKGVIGSMKKGGTVKQTGPYQLHKGEKVVPADVMKKATAGLGGSKKSKRKLQMVIRPTDDDRFHVQHSYSGGEQTDSPMQSTEHAPSSLEELLTHVKNHYGEEQAEGGSGSAKEESAEGEA
jgi:hypothetical protein